MIKSSFKCPLNTPVFTNRQVVEQSLPITIAIHEHDDGSWKFFSKEEKNKSQEQPIMVSLEELLMIDPSVGEVSFLPEGSIATRRYVGDDWKVISTRQNPQANNTDKSRLPQ
jgi:hypothetical protein